MSGNPVKRFMANYDATRTLAALVGFVVLSLFATGCRRDMQDQPKMKPFRSSSFFRDGLSGRQPVEGTVARGYLREDTAFFTAKKSGTTSTTTASSTPASAQNAYPDDVDTFPFAINDDIVRRGQERYNIFCSVCHAQAKAEYRGDQWRDQRIGGNEEDLREEQREVVPEYELYQDRDAAEEPAIGGGAATQYGVRGHPHGAARI